MLFVALRIDPERSFSEVEGLTLFTLSAALAALTELDSLEFIEGSK
jgi:hypothetical protein